MLKTVLLLLLLVTFQTFSISEDVDVDGRIGRYGMTKQEQTRSRKRIRQEILNNELIQLSSSGATIVKVPPPAVLPYRNVSLPDGVAVIGSVTLLKKAVGTKSGDINFEGGTLNYTSDKFVWIFRVSSSTVEALRLHLENVILPSSTELVVYSSTFDAITDGPYR